jgi:hypothetical protein
MLDSPNAELNELVLREVELVISGYTLSVDQKVVVGRYLGTYFMRSSHASATLVAADTSADQLAEHWLAFRTRALAEDGRLARAPRNGAIRASIDTTTR